MGLQIALRKLVTNVQKEPGNEILWDMQRPVFEPKVFAHSADLAGKGFLPIPITNIFDDRIGKDDMIGFILVIQSTAVSLDKVYVMIVPGLIIPLNFIDIQAVNLLCNLGLSRPGIGMPAHIN